MVTNAQFNGKTLYCLLIVPSKTENSLMKGFQELTTHGFHHSYNSQWYLSTAHSCFTIIYNTDSIS